MACNLGGWRAEPSMAIPPVHIAPLGTNAVDARGMARWLSGGGSMVVSSGTSLYRCMHACRIPCQQSMRPWLHSGGARPMDPKARKDVRECSFLKKLRNPKKRHGVSGG